MCRPLRRAVLLLVIAAACTRKDPGPAAASARGTTPAPSSARPAHGTHDGVPALDGLAAPEPCTPSRPDASAAALAAEGRAALAAGAKDKAVACADEALRLSPRLVVALSLRAAALADAGRIEEARLAYARALAVDPGDPEALLGAAQLHVRRLGPARDALETGLEYALRGARAAAARKDRTLAARLVLVAGMAENDLGRSQLALAHLDRALSALPEDPDVVYERAVALYELCRFEEAQRGFERALKLAPDDPWSLHHLGLLAERRGDRARSESLLARARKLAPDDFPAELAVEPAAFRQEVRTAIAALPEGERRALESVPVDVEELPDAEDLLAVDPPLSPSILGLFRGPAEDEPCTAADGPRCRAIVIYRKNLLRFARTRAELAEQVRVTLLHELGHLHGENEDQLRARGLE
jgi:Flp pilus assembly protein TadD/predicted Zn-dependent protease with MMP-like domain